MRSPRHTGSSPKAPRPTGRSCAGPRRHRTTKRRPGSAPGCSMTWSGCSAAGRRRSGAASSPGPASSRPCQACSGCWQPRSPRPMAIGPARSSWRRQHSPPIRPIAARRISSAGPAAPSRPRMRWSARTRPSISAAGHSRTSSRRPTARRISAASRGSPFPSATTAPRRRRRSGTHRPRRRSGARSWTAIIRYCSKIHCSFLVNRSLPKRGEVTDPRHRQILDQRLMVLPWRPKRVLLSHDRSCNLSCPSCRREILVADKDEVARLNELFETTLAPLLRDADSVHVTGSGDAFGSAHFRYVLKRLNRREFPRLRLMLQTNGVCAIAGHGRSSSSRGW